MASDAEVVQRESFLRSALSGSFAGACQTYSGHPLDTVKVRMQTAPLGTYSGIIQCISATYKEGGLRGFYNGATPALTTAIIENTIVFGANESLKKLVYKYRGDSQEELSVSWLAGIGASAGFFQTLFACPAEVVKCRLQVVPNGSAQAGPTYSGPFDCGRKIVAEHGFKGLYKGFTPFVAREVPFYLIFFGAYEAVCGSMQAPLQRQRDQLTAGEVFLAGGIAGCAAWTLVVPADTVKSQLQSSKENLGAIETTRRIFKNEGLFRGLFRGWTAIMIRYAPRL